MNTLTKTLFILLTFLTALGVFYAAFLFRPDKELTEWLVLWGILIAIACKFASTHDKRH